MKTTERRTELRTWRFVVDQNDIGEEFGWHKPEYDHDRWMEVEAYRSWETYDLAMADYEGPGWYHTTVRAPASDKRLVLHFDGIGGIAKVFVNGDLAGETDNRYLPFDVDATPFLQPGQDAAVTVKVDNSYQGRDHLTGGKNIEWVLYGGLTHHVYAEERELCRISHLCIRAQADGTATVEATVENALLIPFLGTVKLEMPEQTLEEKVTVKAGGIQLVTFDCKAADVKPWSPDDPNLYCCKAELCVLGKAVHTAEERFGYRTIEVRGTEIFLNGEKLKLRGSNRYDEYAPYGNCAPEALIREDLLDMKRCGMNLIRTHYPQDPIHYEIADEIGLMYMIEVPLNWWNPIKPETAEDFAAMDWTPLRAQATDTLDRTWQNYCNHPCWVIWSTSNECSHSNPTCRAMFEMLADRMRSYRPGRLITTVTNKPILDSEELAYCDFISMNYYSGVICDSTAEYPEAIEGTLRDKLANAQKLYPDKPHVITEFGYPCVAGMRGSPTEGRFTEDFGATYFKASSEEMMRDPQMQGLITWCWADYRHRRGFISAGRKKLGFNATYGPYGIVTMDRKTKTVVYDAVWEIFRKFR